MTPRRVAVVGGGLGGLAAAGLLARAGARVTLFEAGPRLGGKAATLAHEGIRLDVGPTLLTMPAVVREVFAELGAGDLLPPFTELAMQCEYRWPDGSRFRAWRDPARTLADAAPFGAGEVAGLRRFYADAALLWRIAGEPYLEAPFEGLGDFLGRVRRRGFAAVLRGLRMGTLAQLAARHLRSAALRQFVGRFATYAGASPYEASEVFAIIAHLEREAGVHHVAGGVGTLATALGAAIARLGVEIQLGCRVGWQARGKRLVVGEGRGGAPFDAVVVNADPLSAARREREPLALSGYVLLARVRERLALPHHVVLFSRDYAREFRQLFAGAAADDPTVYICHPAATDASMAPDRASGLYLMTNAPPLPALGGDPPDASALRARCLARLDRDVPGLAARFEILAEHGPGDLARAGAPRGSIYGFLPHGRLAALRRPRMRGPVPGVFFAGGGTHPGGGVPLVLLSARFAAAMALEHLGIRAAA